MFGVCKISLPSEKTGRFFEWILKHLNGHKITKNTASLAIELQQLEDYFRGKESAVKFLVGQVMKSTKGQANPVLATEAIQEKLKTLGKT